MSTRPLVSLRDRREQIITRLSDSFAHGDLEMEEFERRLTNAQRAATVAELEALVEDLPTVAAAPEAKPRTELVPARTVRDKQTVFALMGAANREGQWVVPRHMRVVSMMGGITLDFREARFAAGVSELSIFCIMGGVDVILPPEIAVEAEGTGVMGAFDHRARAPLDEDPERPVLRIKGLAVMGAVDVKTRLPGETAMDAWKRERRERKALRKKREQEQEE
jgi:hypothetical protein